MEEVQKDKRSLKARILLFVLVKLPIAFVLITLLWVTALKWVPVYFTPLTIQRSIQYRNDKEFDSVLRWRSYKNISPEMAKAVIASEDNRFDAHNGFEWPAIAKVLKEHREKGKKLRGASTISQQTAKNVFCLPTRSFIRKGFEAYFTFLIEKIWGKERIMEVYLNVAEMGKGIYGAEAAARHYFNKHASELSTREACLIAVCLPSPLTRNPAKPTKYISSRATSIASLEKKLWYPAWVERKDLSDEQLAKDTERREKAREDFRQKSKEARRKIRTSSN